MSNKDTESARQEIKLIHTMLLRHGLKNGLVVIVHVYSEVVLQFDKCAVVDKIG